MSLAVLADHMASKGRGPDSMLIHMSPNEVAGLQSLAMAHGGSLTINPETGLPEAGFLDKLLPTILGAGLTFMGVPPNVSAMIVGGIQTVRTGDLGKGIQAGLGAYGGANLTSSMTAAGSSAIGSEAAGQSYLSNYAPPAGVEGALGAGLSADMAYNLADAGVSTLGEGAAAANQAAASAVEAASPYEKLSRGFDTTVDQFKNTPMQALKANAKDMAYAFGPAILSELGVKQNMPQTVTKPGMITPYSYFGGQYVAGNPFQATPTRAAEGGLMGMADGGYNPGQLDFAQRSEPVVRMADGGIVALAAGGSPPKIFTDEELFQQTGDWNKAAALRDQQNVALSQYNAVNNPTVGANINKWIQDNPFATAADITNAIKTAGLTQDIVNPYLTANTNISDATRYALSHATEMPGAGGLAGMQANIMKGFAAPNLTQAQIDAEQAKYGLSNADVQSPLTHGYQIADTDIAKATNYLQSNADVQAWLNSAEGRDYIKQHPEFDANDIAYTHYMRYGKGEGRTWEEAAKKPIVCGEGFKLSADGKSCVPDTKGVVTCGPGFKLSTDGKSCVPDTVVVTPETSCPSGQHYDPVLKMCVLNTSATQNTTTTVTTPTDIATADETALPVGVSGAGVTTINPNGTITTRPDIPGIPEGGFTGMQSLRDAYTKGGGSLGYIPYTPKTIEEFDKKYTSKLTGGSKQAYDYLTGKTKYSPIPYTEDGQIAKPYGESVMKLPVASSSKMYIFKNGKYEINPDYAIPTYDKDGKKSSNLTNADVKTFMDKNPSTDAFYTWATTNNLSPEQIALASGRPINEISKLFTGAKDLVGEDGKIDQTKLDEKTAADEKANFDYAAYLKANPDVQAELDAGKANFGSKADLAAAAWEHYQQYGKAEGRKYTKKAASGGLMAMARGGMAQQFDLGGYSDGGRLLRGPGDGVSDSIPATIGNKRPARLADGEFVVPARIVSELGNGSTEAGARKLYAMMDRVQAARRGTVGKGRVAKNSRADKHLPA